MRRYNRISGQFASRLIELLESPAWRTLSLSARRVIERIEIELAHHGGNDNGRLPVTYQNFCDYGIAYKAIAPAVREAAALGFIEVTEKGRAGNAEFRSPSLFRLTFVPQRYGNTHEWRKIATMEDAEHLAREARRTPKKQKSRDIKCRVSGIENIPESTHPPGVQNIPTALRIENTPTLYILGRGRQSPIQLQRLRSHRSVA